MGLVATWTRFTQGLGASTNLSDQFPWGLWIGFDVLCGVALAAGGFTISAAVYIFHVERFRPILRPTILTAFLGYSLVIVALLFDLGRSTRIWHPLIMWNPRSVMFEVGWCVMLYTTVLALEFSPLLWEKLGWTRALKITQGITIPLVVAGVILSTLHQSSLGSLFLIVPGKLHAIWYSPWLPVFFFVSAVGLGFAMTIFESFLSFRAFGRRIELPLLQELGKLIVVSLAVYGVLRIQDLMERGVLDLALGSSYEARLFQAEFLLGVVGPVLLLLVPAFRKDDLGLFVSSLLVISGFVLNRLNVSITGLERSAGFTYTPSWMEWSVTASLVALGFLIFGLAVRYLEVMPQAELSAEAYPAAEQLRRPWWSPSKRAFAGAALVFLLAMGLAWDGIRHRPEFPPAGSPPGVTEPHSAGGLEKAKQLGARHWDQPPAIRGAAAKGGHALGVRADLCRRTVSGTLGAQLANPW